MTAYQSHGNRKTGVFSLFCVSVLIFCLFLHTKGNASEYEEKAEFISDLAKFVQWPGDKNRDSPLQICILGKDPSAGVLKNPENKTVRGRSVSFRVCPEGKGTEDCHIVFVSALEKEHVPAILSRLGSRPVLTVGDFPGFAAEGGIITLIRTGAQLRFEINTDAAQRAGLKISSRLLRLAGIVTAPGEKDQPR